jgi:hypothetical protein
MRRDAYPGDECSEYCLISQTTVYGGEVESDEVPDTSRLPVVL